MCVCAVHVSMSVCVCVCMYVCMSVHTYVHTYVPTWEWNGKLFWLLNSGNVQMIIRLFHHKLSATFFCCLLIQVFYPPFITSWCTPNEEICQLSISKIIVLHNMPNTCLMLLYFIRLCINIQSSLRRTCMKLSFRLVHWIISFVCPVRYNVGSCMYSIESIT